MYVKDPLGGTIYGSRRFRDLLLKGHVIFSMPLPVVGCESRIKYGIPILRLIKPASVIRNVGLDLRLKDEGLSVKSLVGRVR